MKRNNKTILLEENVNFVDITKKRNTYFKLFMFLIAIILSSFFFHLLFKNLNEQQFLYNISKTGNLDFNLISRQYKLKLLAKFMQIKFQNSKLKQSEIADQLGYSSSTLQRYRNDINMLSRYRIQPNITNKLKKGFKYKPR